MAPKRQEGNLADASTQALEGLLNRAGKRRRGSEAAAPASLAAAASGLPPPRQAAQPAACGAPAAPRAEGPAPDSPAAGAAAPPPAAAEAAGSPSAGGDWEDVDDAAPPAAPPSAPPGGGGLVLDLTGDPGAAPKPKRAAFTKADRERARLVHRAHLLCLLARGLLLDAAAGDPAVQAAVLSLAPPALLAALAGDGAASGSGGRAPAPCSAAALAEAVAWFRQTFGAVAVAAADAGGGGDDLAAAAARARGVAGAARRLAAAAAARRGTGEELAALLAALLRAAGVPARAVRLLEPSPLKPGEAAREQEGVLAAFLERSRRPQFVDLTADDAGGGAGGGGAAAPSPAARRAAAAAEALLRAAAARSPAVAAAGGGGDSAAAAATPAKKRGRPRKDAGVAGGGGGGEDSAERRQATKAAGKAPATPAEGAEAGAPARRRRGDEQFERELAMAEAATAFAAAPRPGSAGPSSAAAAGAAFSRRGEHQAAGRHWVEALCAGAAAGAEPRWVHACPLTGAVDAPHSVAAAAPRGRPLAYVAAFAGGGAAADVTARYAPSPAAAEKARDGEWWGATLAALRPGGAPAPGGAGGGAAELAARADAERRGVPTTLAAFRGHPVFVLQRHVGQHEALARGARPCGLHRGEPYFLRADLGEVHTAERWRRLGREVLPAELATPAKRLKKRGMAAAVAAAAAGEPAEGSDDEGDGQPVGPQMSDYFGEWQTRAWVPPAAADGRVPRNERGNVEVPPFAAALPRGCAHIRHPGAAAAARRLGVDAAPALAGFDVHRGRSVPRLEGVVVCVEHAAEVRAAVAAEARRREAEAAAAAAARADADWRALLRVVLQRARLQAAAGGEPGDAAAEAAAAAMARQAARQGAPAAAAAAAAAACAAGGGGGNAGDDGGGDDGDVEEL